MIAMKDRQTWKDILLLGEEAPDSSPEQIVQPNHEIRGWHIARVDCHRAYFFTSMLEWFMTVPAKQKTAKSSSAFTAQHKAQVLSRG